MTTPTLNDLVPDATVSAFMLEIASWYALSKRYRGGMTGPLLGQLNGAINATVTSLDLDPPATGSQADVLPDVGTLLIEGERIRYRDLAGNTFTLKTRGADGTDAAGHADNVAVYLPTSAARLAYRVEEYLFGNGADLPGVGALHSRAIADLGNAYRSQTEAALPEVALPQEAFDWIGKLESHLAGVAGVVLLGVPSSGALTVSNLPAFLIYRNDKTTGSARAMLAPDAFAELYWLFTGGVPLPEKTVAPSRTSLATGLGLAANPAAVHTILAEVGRYSRPSEGDGPRVQGYAAPVVRARCLAVGTATAVAISAVAQGEDADGDRFGRDSVVSATCSGIVATNTLTVNGVVFTAIASGATGDQFNVGGSNVLTAANLAAAVNSSVSAGVAGLIEATDLGTGEIDLSAIDPEDFSEYRVGQSGGHVTLSRDRFGGGDGDNLDGTGADADPARRTFTGSLDLGAVGNVVTLADGASSRILGLVSVAGTLSGTVSGAERWVIETVDPFRLHDLPG